MIRLIAIAGFALAFATSAHAMTLAPLQSDSVITQVREACGAGGKGEWRMRGQD